MLRSVCDGLLVRVADADDLAGGVGGGGAGDVNDVADAHRARIADDGFPRRARGNVGALHGAVSEIAMYESSYACDAKPAMPAQPLRG